MQEFGGYRLIERIGTGGMGSVYRALNGDGAWVAVKILHPAISADPQARARLAREVATMRRVHGPGVAELLDAEVDEDDAFVVTELIDGPTLFEDVREYGAYSAAELAGLAHGLRQALESIHAAGVVHRDLKPSNVMMSASGPVLIDFGIAQVADDARFTQTGLVSGTAGYLDPQALQGEDPSPAGDWWSWAAVLAFAATGRAPFGKGPTGAVISRVYGHEVDLDGLPVGTAQVLRAALSPAVEERPTPAQVVGVLNRCAAGYDDDAASEARTTLLASGNAASGNPAGGDPASGSSASGAGDQGNASGLPGGEAATARVPISSSTGSDCEASDATAVMAEEATRALPGGYGDGATRPLPTSLPPSIPAAPPKPQPAAVPPHQPTTQLPQSEPSAAAGMPGQYAPASQPPVTPPSAVSALTPPAPDAQPSWQPVWEQSKPRYFYPDYAPAAPGIMLPALLALSAAGIRWPEMVLGGVVGWMILTGVIGDGIRATHLSRWQYDRRSGDSMRAAGRAFGHLLKHILAAAWYAVIIAIFAAIFGLLSGSWNMTEWIGPGAWQSQAIFGGAMLLLLVVLWAQPLNSPGRMATRRLILQAFPRGGMRFLFALALWALAGAILFWQFEPVLGQLRAGLGG